MIILLKSSEFKNKLSLAQAFEWRSQEKEVPIEGYLSYAVHLNGRIQVPCRLVTVNFKFAQGRNFKLLIWDFLYGL